MAAIEACDAAVWDLDGTLAGDLRKRLSAKRHRRGPKLTTVMGRWRDRTLVIGSPNRLTAAGLPSLDEALSAFCLAHRPAWLAIVGPGASPTGVYALGKWVIGKYSALALPGEPALSATLHTGSVAADVTNTVATDWATRANEAASGLAVPYDLIAGVCRVGMEGAEVAPPISRPRTRARAVGRWVGRLMTTRPSGEPDDARELCARQLPALIATLLPRRTSREA